MPPASADRQASLCAVRCPPAERAISCIHDRTTAARSPRQTLLPRLPFAEWTLRRPFGGNGIQIVQCDSRFDHKQSLFRDKKNARFQCPILNPHKNTARRIFGGVDRLRRTGSFLFDYVVVRKEQTSGSASPIQPPWRGGCRTISSWNQRYHAPGTVCPVQWSKSQLRFPGRLPEFRSSRDCPRRFRKTRVPHYNG